MEILRGEISSELCRELRSLGATEVLDVQAGLKNTNVKVGSLDDGKNQQTPHGFCLFKVGF